MPNHRLKPFMAVALALFAASVLPAADFSCSSGTGRVALVELFTSEGCSSCPPADRWLEDLRSQPGLWRDFVPVGFHVNYWDNLGWPDRFASRQFTQRQYALASAWRGNSVYTPCFVRNGQEWHPDGDAPVRVAGKPGMLAVSMGEDGICRVRFTPDGGETGGAYEAHVALLGGGYTSKVTAGENRGSTLRHEFVALALVDGPMKMESLSVTAELTLPQNPAGGAERKALAAWVTRAGSLEPEQATGGWLN